MQCSIWQYLHGKYGQTVKRLTLRGLAVGGIDQLRLGVQLNVEQLLEKLSEQRLHVLARAAGGHANRCLHAQHAQGAGIAAQHVAGQQFGHAVFAAQTVARAGHQLVHPDALIKVAQILSIAIEYACGQTAPRVDH